MDGGEINVAVLEDFVGRVWIVEHLVFVVVLGDGGSAESFEDADLDFVWAQGNEPVEAGSEAVECFAGEADDEVGVDVDAGVVAEPAKVGFGFGVVLLSMDAGGDFGVERLDADFELDGTGWESLDEGTEGFRKPVGDHFKVEEKTGLIPFEEKFEDRGAGVEVEVEGAVNEFEGARAPLEEALHRGEKFLQWKLTDRSVERREAKVAMERAAARCFDVEDAVCDVLISVEVVGQGEIGEIR